jgi:NADH-quinone oxidoreductase subunit E
VLGDEEKRRIDEQTGHYDDKRAASVEALQIVQRYRRWISNETLRDVALELGITPEELDSLATFYNLVFRKPVGRHVILVCDSISCWIVGGEGIGRRLEALLGVGMGETTADGEFTLLPVQCLGACDGAPALMIDADLHRNVDPENLEAVLDRYREGRS